MPLGDHHMGINAPPRATPRQFAQKTMPFAAQHIKTARLQLQQRDPILRQIIRRAGPFTARTHRDRFETLVQSIVSQQISGSAARSILCRLEEMLKPGPVRADRLAVRELDDLRGIGLSRQKAGYILDLAQKVHTNDVNLSAIGRMDDEQVIAELTKVKGIGVWTAQMFLIFSLGRLDVFPAGDLGIQNAIKKQYKLRGKLNMRHMEKIALPWRPYATVASWYLWRSLEFSDTDKG
jgi:DNA-3-methyladenine glycosylase II